MRFRPPPTPTARALCSSAKIPYLSQREAEAARDHNETIRGVLLDVYQCPECLSWHLTSRADEAE
jgi:hypothetical protein